ncbi:unnamed protein product [Darwinula stevensoni]|uniref:Uncharacterized protein n=1 Tax=Darwinula stevensoni TaxID=69355 RepID=A0A7R8XCN0_9CRUS|nr:unnamed protein product [Darwinula stevensoni]CAG0885965.1 unnamed protein product [Darwinula stevensoni]
MSRRSSTSQALQSTPTRGLENIGGNLEEMMESLRAAYKELKHDFENMRKEHEKLKSSLQEHLREGDELKLQLNATEGRLQYLEAISLQITPRTCQTLADLGVTRTGEYLVDPDGVLIGDAPIKVLCNMERDPVSTIVLHDSMGNTEIERCADPGCYNHSISMTVSRRPSQRETYTMHGGWTVTANLSTTGTDQTQDNTCANAGKTPPPDNPAESCSSLHRAGNTHPGYYLINSKKGRLDVVMCRMDLEETDPKFQEETTARIEGEGFLHGKVTSPGNPAESCSSLRQAGNTQTGYHLITNKEGRKSNSMEYSRVLGPGAGVQHGQGPVAVTSQGPVAVTSLHHTLAKRQCEMEPGPR